MSAAPPPADPVFEVVERLMAAVQSSPRPVVTAALIAWAGRWVAIQALQQDKPLEVLLPTYLEAITLTARTTHARLRVGWVDRN